MLTCPNCDSDLIGYECYDKFDEYRVARPGPLQNQITISYLCCDCGTEFDIIYYKQEVVVTAEDS